MSESGDIRLEGVTLLLLRWKGPQANKWRLPLGAGICRETDSPLEMAEPEALLRLR